MSGLSSILSGIPNPTINLRDYQSAADTFNPNNYSNLPKTKRWFHLYFELNPAAINVVSKTLDPTQTAGRINWPVNNLAVLGILVRGVKLPNFHFDVRRMNQYNRWSLNINKVEYAPIEINFWDDCVDQMTGFWYGYYSYMVQDPNYTNFFASQNEGVPVPFEWDQNSGSPQSGYSSLYNNSDAWANKFGLDTQINGQEEFGRNQPFFKSIRIYQFNRATNTQLGSTYNEFVLVNPIISGFNYSDLEYSSPDFMSNSMTIEYETVLFNSGLLGDDEIASWDAVQQRFFDDKGSPLGNPETATILKQINTAASQAIVTENQIASVVSLATTPGGIGGSAAELNAVAEASQIGLATVVSVPIVANSFGSGGNPPGA